MSSMYKIFCHDCGFTDEYESRRDARGAQVEHERETDWDHSTVRREV